MNKKEKRLREEFQIEFGEHIKKVRISKGLSIGELAKQCYLDKPNLIRIEKGRINTSIYQIKKISDALELNLEQFFKGI